MRAETPDRLHPECGSGGAARRAVGEVVLQRAVQQVGVGSWVLAVHAHREPVRDHRAIVAVRKHVHSRVQLHQVGVVASIDRKVFDRPLIGQEAELPCLGVHRRRAADRHLLGSADLHRQRHRGALTDGQPHARLHERAERIQRCPQLVLAGRQGRRAETPLRIGDELAGDACGEGADPDGHTGEPAALGVLDNPNQSGQCLCCRAHRGEACEKDERCECSRHSSGNRAPLLPYQPARVLLVIHTVVVQQLGVGGEYLMKCYRPRPQNTPSDGPPSRRCCGVE